MLAFDSFLRASLLTTLVYPFPVKLMNNVKGRPQLRESVRIGFLMNQGGGLRFSSKIPNFSLLEYLALPTQRGFKTALRKQIHDIGTDRSNMSRDHSLLRLATIHYSSINNLFNPNSLRVLPWCITRPLYSKIRAMFESVYAVS